MLLKFLEETDYFAFVFRVLKYIRIFPFTKPEEKKRYNILAAIHFTIFAVILLILEIWYVLTRPDGFIQAVKAFGTIVYHIACTIRMIHCFLNVDTYVELWRALNRDSFNFENYNFDVLNDFPATKQPVSDSLASNYSCLKGVWSNINIFRKENENERNELKQIQKKIMTETRVKSYIAGSFILISAYVSLLFSYSGCLFNAGKVYYNPIKKIEMKRYEVPYNSIQLIDMQNSLNHKIALCYQAYAIGYLTAAFLLIDSLFHAYLIHMSGQLKVIDVMIKRIRIDESVRNDPSKERIVDAQFVKCAEEIQHVININDKLERLISIPLFLHYQFATYIMCAIIYALPEEKDPLKLWGYGLFGALALVHPLACCWNNHELIDQFGQLPDSMYNINYWYESSLEFRKKLLFSMFRLQKPVVITIGKFSVQNLQYFILVLQKGYSLFTLFNNTNKTI